MNTPNLPRPFLCPRSITVTLLAMGLAACSQSASVELGSVHVKSALIAAATGGEITISAAESARLAGTVIRIAPLALAQDTKITIGTSDKDAVDADSESAGPVVEFGPAGTAFAVAAEVIIPYTGVFDEDLVRVVVTQADGTRTILLPEELTYDATAKTIRFTTPHFTRFQSGRGRRPCAHVMCPANQCRRGRCVTPPPPSCGMQTCAANETCQRDPNGGARCVPTTNACMTDRDCPNGAACVQGQCSTTPTGCGPNGCPRGETCERDPNGGARCVPTTTACMTDRDCANGAACVNGVCGGQPNNCGVVPCAANETCQRDMNGNPICVPTTTACRVDNDCPRGPCVNGQCTTGPALCGMVPCAANETCQRDPNGGARCVPNPTACMTDRDCANGSACVNGVCGGQTSSCAAVQCRAGEVCRESAMGPVCIPTNTACMTDRDCANGAACVNGVCGGQPVNCGVVPCAANETCQRDPSGQPVCVPNSNACMTDRDCVAGQQLCVNFRCEPLPPLCGMVTCAPNETCQRDPNGQPVCVALPTRCMADSDCAAGQQVCVQGVCQAGTSSCGPSACGAGEMCCNASCGLCVGPNMGCPAIACVRCGGGVCRPSETCERDPMGGERCVPQACGPNDCGPPLGQPNYLCQDGVTIAGPTGRCLVDAGGPGQCGWEVITCP